MQAEVAVSSSDMDKFAANGKMAFDHFNVTVPNKDPSKPALAEVEDIDGEIPFTQEISLKAIAELQKKLQKGPAGGMPGVVTKDGAVAKAGEKPAAKTVGEKKAEVAKKEQAAGTTVVVAKAAAPSLVVEDDAVSAYLKRKMKHSEVQSIIPRVDYGKTRDFYPGKRILRINRVAAANLTLRNLEFDMELKKERFALNNFGIDFLDGKIQGSLQIPMELLPQSVHLELHMTKLNTQRLLDNFPNLKSKTQSFLLTSDPVIEGVVLFDFDLVQNDIGGAIDITTIGKEQLKMMLYYLDPEEKDNTLGLVRKALIVGDVKRVSIPIRNGFLGMEVDLTALGVPIPLPKISRIPISQIIKNVKDGAQSASNEQSGEGTDDL